MVRGNVIAQCKWTIRPMCIVQLHFHGPSFMDHLTFTFGTARADVFLMNTSISKAAELEQRFIAFAARVVELSVKFPANPQGRHICRQLRSGTATAANYGE